MTAAYPTFEQVICQVVANPCNKLQETLALCLAGEWPYDPTEEQVYYLLTSGRTLKDMVTPDGREIVTYADFCGPWVLKVDMDAFKVKFPEFA